VLQARFPIYLLHCTVTQMHGPNRKQSLDLVLREHNATRLHSLARPGPINASFGRCVPPLLWPDLMKRLATEEAVAMVYNGNQKALQRVLTTAEQGDYVYWTAETWGAVAYIACEAQQEQDRARAQACLRAGAKRLRVRCLTQFIGVVVLMLVWAGAVVALMLMLWDGFKVGLGHMPPRSRLMENWRGRLHSPAPMAMRP
jgi:hypothetical protein